MIDARPTPEDNLRFLFDLIVDGQIISYSQSDINAGFPPFVVYDQDGEGFGAGHTEHEAMTDAIRHTWQCLTDEAAEQRRDLTAFKAAAKKLFDL